MGLRETLATRPSPCVPRRGRDGRVAGFALSSTFPAISERPAHLPATVGGVHPQRRPLRVRIKQDRPDRRQRHHVTPAQEAIAESPAIRAALSRVVAGWRDLIAQAFARGMDMDAARAAAQASLALLTGASSIARLSGRAEDLMAILETGLARCG